MTGPIPPQDQDPQSSQPAGAPAQPDVTAPQTGAPETPNGAPAQPEAGADPARQYRRTEPRRTPAEERAEQERAERERRSNRSRRNWLIAAGVAGAGLLGFLGYQALTRDSEAAVTDNSCYIQSDVADHGKIYAIDNTPVGFTLGTAREGGGIDHLLAKVLYLQREDGTKHTAILNYRNTAPLTVGQDVDVYGETTRRGLTNNGQCHALDGAKPGVNSKQVIDAWAGGPNPTYNGKIPADSVIAGMMANRVEVREEK